MGIRVSLAGGKLRWICGDINGTVTVSASDANAANLIAKFIRRQHSETATTKRAKAAAEREAQLAEKQRVAKWKRNTVAQMKSATMTELVDFANGCPDLFRTQTAQKELTRRRAAEAAA